ncbi:2600_t:CDS:2 [Funneliformis geosporum]|uniref:1913_t:CDS:1 n=1 Tax=Funneliformis geosporum TaxID=1117311 RepID=A0A9W4WNT8_9GLOM|nr:1913_t:CDS:2 [Funneliformis geosporum]CAI2170360.1 2600_t:CDS:2 [Funneliformis geosporum]
MSQAIKSKRWTTDEIIEILSYINDHFKNSSVSLAKACDEATEHLHIERTRKSVYLKIRKLIQTVKVWLSDHIKNDDAIIWQDDRVYKLLETICKRSMKDEATFGEKEKLQQEQIFKENNKIEDSVIIKSEEHSSDLTDSTITGDYVDPVGIYMMNEANSSLFQLSLKIINDRIREVEDDARKVYGSASDARDVKCHEILQVIKQTHEYRDEMYQLFAEVEKKPKIQEFMWQLQNCYSL